VQCLWEFFNKKNIKALKLLKIPSKCALKQWTLRILWSVKIVRPSMAGKKVVVTVWDMNTLILLA